MQRQFPVVGGACVQTFRQNGESTPYASEASVLREATELDRAFARAWNFIDRMRDRRVANVRLVRCIEKDDGLMLARVFDPAR